MTNHDQKNIIQEQMRANKRIIKAAASMPGQYIGRMPLNERMKHSVERRGTKPSSQSPKRKMG
jgi:hypothetical protein